MRYDRERRSTPGYTSCDYNPTQKPCVSFHRFPSDRDRRTKWFSVLGMNESQLRVAACREFVPGTFPMAMPKENQWLAQAVCSLYVRGRKRHRNYSCYFRNTYNNPAAKKESLAEGCCTPVDIARQHRSETRSYVNRFSLRVYRL